MSDSRPLGPPIPGFKPPRLPDGKTMKGRFALLERLDSEKHAEPLFRAYEGHDWVWDYMPCDPFSSVDELRDWMRQVTGSKEYLFYAIYDQQTGQYGGFASYMRMKPESGVIEVGFIAMAPFLQRTCAATEAMYMMMKWVFEAGYRRYEWKCDALNAPSRTAAKRLGFSYEGVFRNATIVKGRNRDTAWFSVIDSEWPALERAYEEWLSPMNFDGHGTQVKRLSALTGQLHAHDS